MVSGNGFIWTGEGYVDAGDRTIITIEELIHSTYGTIKYVVYRYGADIEDTNIPIEWNFESYPRIPDDWEDEL